MKYVLTALGCVLLSACAVTPKFNTYQVAEGQQQDPSHVKDRRTLFRMATAEVAVKPLLVQDRNTGIVSGSFTLTAAKVGWGPFYAAKGTSSPLQRTSAVFNVDPATKVLESVNIETEDLLVERIEQVAGLAAAIIGLDQLERVRPEAKVIATFPEAGTVIRLATFIDPLRGYTPSPRPVDILAKPSDSTDAVHTGWTYTVDFADGAGGSSVRLDDSVLALGKQGVFPFPACAQVRISLSFDPALRDKALGETSGYVPQTADEIASLPASRFEQAITVPDPVKVDLVAMPAKGAVQAGTCGANITKQELVERDPVVVGQTLLDAYQTIKKAQEAE